jgi:hypothetical protein
MFVRVHTDYSGPRESTSAYPQKTSRHQTPMESFLAPLDLDYPVSLLLVPVQRLLAEDRQVR